MARRRRSRRGGKRGRRSKARATKRARVVLSKVNYLPSESKLKDVQFIDFSDTSSDANSINPDITVSYEQLTIDITQGTSDQERIGNTIYVKRAMWTYAFQHNTTYSTFAQVSAKAKFPGIHVFLIAVKCTSLSDWWTDTTGSGANIRPTAFDSDYRRLRSSNVRIIRHWKIGRSKKFTDDVTSAGYLKGKLSHTFNTPIKVVYVDTGSKILTSGNQLAFLTYRVNDGDAVAVSNSWDLEPDTGYAYHNLRRINFMG